METIKLIVKSILVVIMLASLLEVILPRGDMKRYINLIIGLFVIISILNPVLSLVRQGVSFDIFDNMTIASEETNALITKGKEISDGQKSQAAKNYKDKLAKQIMGLTGLYQGNQVSQVEIDMVDNPADPQFGEINKIILYGTQTAKNQQKDKEPSNQTDIKVEEISVLPQGNQGLETRSDAKSDAKLDTKSDTKSVNKPALNKKENLQNVIADFYGIRKEQVEIRN